MAYLIASGIPAMNEPQNPHKNIGNCLFNATLQHPQDHESFWGIYGFWVFSSYPPAGYRKKPSDFADHRISEQTFLYTRSEQRKPGYRKKNIENITIFRSHSNSKRTRVAPRVRWSDQEKRISESSSIYCTTTTSTKKIRKQHTNNKMKTEGTDSKRLLLVQGRIRG